MIFYSRENGKDGEKDYIDTNDLKDVYFEADTFNYIEEGRNNHAKISFKLGFNESAVKMYLEGEAPIGDSKVTFSVDIEDPVKLVEEGAVAYYAEKMLDEVETIKIAKEAISNHIKGQLLNRGLVLKGTSMDAMGIIENNGNIISVVDNITINDANKVRAELNYSITSIESINAGTLTIYLTNEKAFRGKISSIEVNDNGSIQINSTEGFTLVDEVSEPYIKSREFNTREEYTENRAAYIKIEANTEADFDEFDDLF